MTSGEIPRIINPTQYKEDPGTNHETQLQSLHLELNQPVEHLRFLISVLEIKYNENPTCNVFSCPMYFGAMHVCPCLSSAGIRTVLLFVLQSKDPGIVFCEV